ncbi:MAG: nucleotidyltransferase substrate binding protein [Hyphomonadaceae bacterium]|nr:nucleotidyltransferase substrate binding protein [Hyphomonadaceae bacterium]
MPRSSYFDGGPSGPPFAFGGGFGNTGSMTDDEIQSRWRYRYANYAKAVSWLREGCDLVATRGLTRFEQAGVIQHFEMTWELGWKLLADLLVADGLPLERGAPRAVVRAAQESGLIADGQVWIDMIDARNKLSHLYDERLAADLLTVIARDFLPSLEALEAHVRARS